jgi:uncharacterized membrane protein YdfJ with MMPL/SSD domain
MNRLRRWPNPAATAGRWSARHWKTATLAWVAFVALAAVFGGLAGTEELGDADGMNGESAQAQRIIDQAGFPAGSSEAVLVQSSTSTADSADFRRAVHDVVSTLRTLPNVTDVTSPYSAGNRDQISQDGHTAAITMELSGKTAEPYNGVERARDAIAAVQRRHPDLSIDETGDASIDVALDETVEQDNKRAELFSIPVTLAILIVAFGAALAALLPVLLALTAVIGATGLLAFASHVLPVEDAASSVMLLIGLAVGVDYSLFYLKREREERAAGRSAQAALDAAAAATSGRSVLLSGLTVIVAMAGMAFAGNQSFLGIALGTIIVVAIAVVGSLTVLPAMLSRLGEKIDRGRIPGLRRVRDGRDSRLWRALLDPVLRRPLIAALLSGGLVVALALPALGLRTADPGASDLPQDVAAVQTLDRIKATFPGRPAPAEVVIRADNVTTPKTKTAIERLEREASTTGAAHPPFEIAVNPNKTVAVVSMPLPGDGVGDPTSEEAVANLRQLASTAFAGIDSEVAVGGETAASRDFSQALGSHLPLVFGFVLVLAFLLLMAAFRAPVIAVTAILLNLLSVGAAYGLLVIVFQHGIGSDLLGFHPTGTIVSWLPLFLFVVLFGLSMDYHVFILSRIHEARNHGLDTRNAVAHGIKSTAGVVTAAACVMVLVFAVFATLSQLSTKQLGVGLAAAILIDATIVRAVLLPATMTLLGEHNWHPIRHESTATPDHPTQPSTQPGRTETGTASPQPPDSAESAAGVS